MKGHIKHFNKDYRSSQGIKRPLGRNALCRAKLIIYIKGAVTEWQSGSARNISQTYSSYSHYSKLKPVAKIRNRLVGQQREGNFLAQRDTMPIHRNNLFHQAESLPRKLAKARNNERNERMVLCNAIITLKKFKNLHDGRILANFELGFAIDCQGWLPSQGLRRLHLGGLSSGLQPLGNVLEFCIAVS